jgi:hypothetical protein
MGGDNSYSSHLLPTSAGPSKVATTVKALKFPAVAGALTPTRTLQRGMESSSLEWNIFLKHLFFMSCRGKKFGEKIWFECFELPVIA